MEVDVRVIAATNKDLEREMAEGRFRDDLFYRLNVIPLHVPSLRDRREDIPHLVDWFLDRFCAASSVSRKELASAALEALLGYPWPGNVRELQNLIERLVLMTPHDRIEFDDLPSHIREPDAAAQARARTPDTLAEARAAFEREFLLEKLQASGWNISRTAELVGLKRESLSRKIRSLGIDLERERNGG
jgi:two-component system nitrogen regulation response regulator NtrX